MDINGNDGFNPIDFLGLQSLNKIQKERLVKPLIADMAAFLIDTFVENLDKNIADEFLTKLEEVKDSPVMVNKLMEEISPEFGEKKMAVLELYRENFKLQKFQSYL